MRCRQAARPGLPAVRTPQRIQQASNETGVPAVSHLPGPITAVLIGAVMASIPAGGLAAKERVEHFDKDPGWDGQNNRAAAPEKRTVRQDFGYSPTAHAGGKAGEVGGFITPAAETAYYAKK